MNKKEIDNQEKNIRTLLSGTTMKADDKLKCRIMKQIETEKALSRKYVSSTSTIRNMVSVFGVMYAVIILMGLGVYFTMGKSTLESTTFYLPALFVVFIGGLFWLVSCIDDARKNKAKN